MENGADISACGRYRYRLWRLGIIPDTHRSHDRGAGDDRACLFIMLNPSTADATTDDPTIRKCVGFCKRWGYGRLFVVNLFAYRSTSPKKLLDVEDPVGPDNDVFLREEIKAAHRVVLAWGSHSEVRALVSARAFYARRFWENETSKPSKIVTLGRCKDGNPRHPLMLAYSTESQPSEVPKYWDSPQFLAAGERLKST